MAPPFWKTDRVNNITPANLIRSITFLKQYEGGLYSDLNQNAIEYFDKPVGSPYFGQIVTHMNILGLFIRNQDGTFNLSPLANFIFQKQYLASFYLEYVLLKFQFPRPHIPGNPDFISKPYFIILKILTELWEIDHNEAYLTQKEFYYLFEEEINTINLVTPELINRIIENKRNWGNQQIDLSNIGSIISYDKAFFSNSLLISTDGNDYLNAPNFFIGLTKNNDLINFAKFLIKQYSNTFYSYSLGNADENQKNKNEWAFYLNNLNDFYRYLNQKNMLQYNIEFKEFCGSKGFYFEDNLIRRFLTSLASKPFLLLTGISGTGKSKIAELFGEFLNSKNIGSYIIKAVGSNWNDNKNLLGYFNPIIDNGGRYIGTDVVDFILEANNNPQNLYILLLDEMNLSYTERYFSDFLSALESLNKNITLANGDVVKWSENLKVIGTINEDETTHTLSPKVIDRANIIEMNGRKPSIYLNSLIERNDIKVQNLVTKDWHTEYISHLDSIYDALDGKFGYRTIDEISNYVIINADFTNQNHLEFLDEQVYQKLLPKLHGTRGEILEKLEKLQSILDTPDYVFISSNAKVIAMINQVRKTGFTSFVTA